MKARVVRSGKRDFDCFSEELGGVITASAEAEVLKGSHVVVGDWVELEKTGEEDFKIVKTIERSSEIFRMIPREQKKKVIASNCDVVVILMSASKPKYKEGLVDRYILRALQWDIPCFLVFNKMDQFNDDFDLPFANDRVAPLGVKTYEISAVDPDLRPQFIENGFYELQDDLKGRTAIFLGQSGVGKSKTISAITNNVFKLKSKELAKVGKGAHTTTWAELIQFEDFSLIDSPGVRSFSIDDVPQEGFIEYFPELAQLATNCKFNDCTHTSEGKNCYFNSLDPENRKDEIILSRLDSYHRLLEEASLRPDWQKK